MAQVHEVPALSTRTLALFIAAGAVGACHKPKNRPPVQPIGQYSIPRTQGVVTIDGKCGERSWQNAFRSPVFEDAQGHTAPHTELRATADDDFLYIEVFVSDIDIESKCDIVKLDVGPVHVDLMPTGAQAPAGVRTAVDVDDTVDNPKDKDEEWVNEVAIPWSLLGGHDVPVRALRIDVGHGESPHGLAWPRTAPALLRFDPKTGA
jgi:hypothetical protein